MHVHLKKRKKKKSNNISGIFQLFKNESYVWQAKREQYICEKVCYNYLVF